MEFRKCPACEASVLEDDAADCPFCGASMSGKPTTSKKPPAAKAPSRPVAKPATQKPAPSAAGTATAKPTPSRQLAKRPAGTSKTVEDADPFDVDTSVIAQAPPIAPRPAKGRMVRIVCPMCETPGFISPKMQGRDVKCCNPECMVPVFKAPRPERKVEQVEEPRGLSARMLLGGVAIGLPVLLFGVWFFVLRDSGPAKWVPTDRPVSDSSEAADGMQSDGTHTTETGTSGRTRLTLTEVQSIALTQGVEAARERDGEGNRSKPYCRRLMAEAYAQAGNLTEARHQIERLQHVTTEDFYKCEPLVEIAWQELASGQRSAATKTVGDAFASARDFPPFGRSPVSAVAAVGSALTVVDRVNDAREVVHRLNRDDETSLARERVAALVQIAFDLRSFDLDQILEYSSLDMAAEPVAIAVTTGAAAQGAWKQAIAWALASPEKVTQEDCLAAAAVVAAWEASRIGKTTPVDAVLAASQSLTDSGRSRVAAGVATGYLLRGDRTAASSALAQALALIESVPRPAAIPQPDVKRIHDAADERDYGLPDPAPYRSAAIGVAQIARLQALLGEKEAAWSTFLKAWEFTRGMGPEWQTTSGFANELANSRPRAEQRVRRDLGISNQDLLSRAFNRYARSCRRWGEAAETRFQLEVSLLNEAIRWGLLDQVAEMLTNPTSVVPSAVGQSYQSTSLVSTLAEAYSAIGEDAKSSQLAESATRQRTASEPIAPLVAETERLFRNEKYLEAAVAVGRFRTQGRHDVEQLRDLRAMQLACRMVKLKDPDKYFPFILAFKDSILTEDCFELTAALAVREGMALDLWNRYSDARLSATQRVAFFRGLIAGIASLTTSPVPGGAQTAAVTDHGSLLP